MGGDKFQGHLRGFWSEVVFIPSQILEEVVGLGSVFRLSSHLLLLLLLSLLLFVVCCLSGRGSLARPNLLSGGGILRYL